MSAKKPKKQPRKAHVARTVWQKGFLKSLASHGNVTLAARNADIDRSTVYTARGIDAGFAKQMDAAIEEAADILEGEAWRRAVQGTDEPVFGTRPGEGTVVVGAVKRFSDTLLIFLLKGANPKKFREHHHHTSDGSLAAKNVVVYLPDNRRNPPAERPPGKLPRK